MTITATPTQHADESVQTIPVVRCITQFRNGVRAAAVDGAVELSYDSTPVLRLRNVSPAAVDRLLALNEPGRHDATPPLAAEDQAAYDKSLHAVRRCLAEGIWVEDHQIASTYLLENTGTLTSRALVSNDVIRLSKFTYLRNRDGKLHIECPVTGGRVEACDPRVLDAVSRLARATSVGDYLGGLTDPAEQPIYLAIAEALVKAGAVDVADASGALASDAPVQRQWDFHDLLFHSRSRYGRTDEAFGGVFPYRGELEPLPPVRPHHSGVSIELPHPTMSEILERDAALVTVMEGRHSTRHYGERPMTVEQLGEFLYRVARVRGTYGPMPDTGMPYPASSRPYPCGGAGYELEIYVTVRRCEGLEPGTYHYESDTHRLTRLDTSEALQRQLLDGASVSAGGGVTPDVLLSITARFQRISWKYRSIAYAVTLKHVGVLYQTMYLVATAMGIGACGLGSGNSDLSAAAFGTDYLVESSVGEFILGSLPRTTPAEIAACRNPIGKPGADSTWQAGLDPEWYTVASQALPGGEA